MKTDAEIADLIQDVASSSPGIEEITVDGVRVKREKGALEHFERRAARNSVPVTLPVSASIDLSG